MSMSTTLHHATTQTRATQNACTSSYALLPLHVAFLPQFHDEIKGAVDACLNLSPVGDCSTGPHGPISDWDVSRVTDMKKMFYEARLFNQDLSKWNVREVKNMRNMFNGAELFNQDLSSWNVGQVIDMSTMFKGATSFEQVLCGTAWVGSKARKGNMFRDSPGSIATRSCFSPQDSVDLKSAVTECWR